MLAPFERQRPPQRPDDLRLARVPRDDREPSAPLPSSALSGFKPAVSAWTPRVLVIARISVCEATYELLRRCGFDVTVTDDGLYALMLAQSDRPDLLIIEPGHTGIPTRDLMQRLRRDRRTADVPVLMLESLGDWNGRMRGAGVAGQGVQFRMERCDGAFEDGGWKRHSGVLAPRVPWGPSTRHR